MRLRRWYINELVGKYMRSTTTSPEKLNIKEWSEEDRPREKMRSKGRRVLSNAELIAILIGSGNKKESAVGLAKRILADFDNDLNALSKLNELELIKYNGIGEAKAIAIIAALELGRRRIDQEVSPKSKIRTSRAAFEDVKSHFFDLSHEEFWVICLNRSNMVSSKFMLSKGGVSGTIADVKLIFKNALEHTASSIIVCHNHPSGNLEPSVQDRAITEKIKAAGKIMDIGLLDHLIISDNNYYSFADNGLI